ncbi:MAG: TonB family protein [Candidatus Tectomicrobia bacterium]|nr:TonB family protein [Candidatus Tectomicrobia bacterium]
MKKVKAEGNASYRGNFAELRWFVIASAIFHILLVSVALVFSSQTKVRTFYSPTYTVSLVDGIGGQGGNGQRKADVVAKVETPPKMEQPQEPPKPVVKPELPKVEKPPQPVAKPEPPKIEKPPSPPKLSPSKPQEKVPVPSMAEPDQQKKKPPPKDVDEQKIRDVIASFKKKVESQGQASEARKIDQAIEKMRESVARADSGGPAKAGGSGSGTGGGLAEKLLDLKYRIYYNALWERIRNAWVLPDGFFSKRKDLEAIISLEIKRDGEIQRMWVEKGSGDAQFDESVIRAVKKSSPLPPIPDGIKEEILEVGIRFTLADVRNS